MLVRQVMTTDPVTVRAGTTVKVALRLLDENDISSLPVIDEHGRVLGVVSRRDVVRMLARADETLEQEVDALLVSAGMRDWLVDVHDGIAEISGPASARERTLAKTLARTVPGVVAVNVP